MHDITDLPAWERLFKKIVWKQLGDMEGKKMVKVQRLFAKTNLKILQVRIDDGVNEKAVLTFQ